MNSPYHVTPCFIDGSAGKLFVLHYAPPSISEKSECIVIAASFAEEMNRCRYMSTLLAQSPSSQGYGFLYVDAYGTGDSTGELRGFIDINVDIHSAVNTLSKHIPEIEKFVLWGECKSATASTFYCYSDTRIQNIFMVNPWIRSDSSQGQGQGQGQTKTILKHYYWERLFDKAFWRKVWSVFNY